MSVVDMVFNEIAATDERYTLDHFFGETLRREAERAVSHYAAVNRARLDGDALSWDYLILEAAFRGVSETEPSLRIDWLSKLMLLVDESLEQLHGELRALEDGDPVGVDPFESDPFEAADW